MPVLVVAGVCQYFFLWTKIDICLRIIGECFRLEPLCIGWRIIWLPLFRNICPNPALQHGIVDLTVVITGIRADGLCLKAKLVNLRFQSTGMGRAVIYIPRCYENICNNTRFGITGLVIQIAEGIGLSGTIHQSGLRIGGAFGDCSRLFGIGDWFIQQSCFQSFSVQLLHILGRRIRHLDDFPLLLCGICQNMRGIRQKQFPGHQSRCHALADNLVKNILKQGCPSEFPAAKLGNGRVIRNGLVKVNAQKPAERDIDPNLLLQLPL